MREARLLPQVEEYEPRLLYSADLAAAGLGLAGLAASLSGAVPEPSEPPSGDFTLFD